MPGRIGKEQGGQSGGGEGRRGGQGGDRQPGQTGFSPESGRHPCRAVSKKHEKVSFVFSKNNCVLC